MIDIYARTFRIATMTDARETAVGSAAEGRIRGGRGWFRSAWRRISRGAA